MHKLELMRVRIPDQADVVVGKVRRFFDFLSNNSGITEEYLYTHQPTQADRIPVYSTSRRPVGYLDDNEEVRDEFNVVDGPAIVVARKGYAGRLFCVPEGPFIVHEDAYPIRPKVEYVAKIDLKWFAEHYSAEFESGRTSFWGIGDFPRTKCKDMVVNVPPMEFQKRVGVLYERRRDIIEAIENYKARADESVTAMLREYGEKDLVDRISAALDE